VVLRNRVSIVSIRPPRQAWMVLPDAAHRFGIPGAEISEEALRLFLISLQAGANRKRLELCRTHDELSFMVVKEIHPNRTTR